MTVVCRESYSSQSVPLSYRRNQDGTIEVFKEGSNHAFSSLAQTFRTVFLPQGYPESVSEDYLAYQIWDTIQAFCSSITGTLATQAMLKGVGVGDVTATAAAATITWLLKDGTGMCGRIVFAWYQGSSLDCDAKRWRLFADILNDAAICIELISPLFPYYFTAIACVSGVLKSIVGVAGGATRAALTLHQARRNNMADVSAKDGSQETLVNLAALVVGLLITPMVSGNPLLTWFLFFLFTFFHLYANYRAVTCVVMNTLNQARLHIIMKEYLTTRFLHILSPAEANAREPVLRRVPRPLEVNLGAQFGQLCKRWSDMERWASSSSNEKYWLGLDRRTGFINILLHRDCTSQDIIEACFQAEIIVINTENEDVISQYFDSRGDDPDKYTKGDQLPADASWKVVRLSGLMAESLYPNFALELRNTGWVIGHTLLGTNEWRAEWSMTGIPEGKSFKSL
ncbi:RUS1 family protein C16orf58 homolog isoform X1 [Asterias rubens]|uniref:RUS1 family protein C16orf58 homolog isoform X1 n=2 Tax=Asterias rubens TaxID=7604 RepID=UPI001455B8FF|nr:RUS1 family protein C16orf58 homolog isoform X1 [Asterias rubens]